MALSVPLRGNMWENHDSYEENSGAVEKVTDIFLLELINELVSVYRKLRECKDCEIDETRRENRIGAGEIQTEQHNLPDLISSHVRPVSPYSKLKVELQWQQNNHPIPSSHSSSSSSTYISLDTHNSSLKMRFSNITLHGICRWLRNTADQSLHHNRVKIGNCLSFMVPLAIIGTSVALWKTRNKMGVQILHMSGLLPENCVIITSQLVHYKE